MRSATSHLNHFKIVGKVVLCLILLWSGNYVFAQVDTLFWFAAPEVTAEHGDEPIFLYITAQENQTDVSVSIPANASFEALTNSLDSAATWRLSLASIKNLIENHSPNAVQNKGLRIASNHPISAYYEVVGRRNNPDIFTLKGNNALGTHFFTPFQTDYNNYFGYDAYSSIDIVASEDETLIQITPTTDLVGHQAAITYSVLLQKGQTYSARAVSQRGNQHPAGTEISSNKPIAVTLKDDSVLDGGWDLIGDQLVPVSSLGEEYIAGEGIVLIVGTEDNTEITINNTQDMLLNKGEQLSYTIDSSEIAYIKSNEKVCIWHLVSLDGIIEFQAKEYAGAVLPAIDHQCAGSSGITFTRLQTSQYKISILVEKGGEDSFIVNGDSSFIDPNQFKVIEQTNGEWLYAVFDISDSISTIPIGQAANITNSSHLFQMSITAGWNGLGTSYGYFSDYGSIDLGPDREVCLLEESYTLSVGNDKDSYLWNTGSTNPSIQVDSGGTYYVEVTLNNCTAYDTIDLTIKQGIDIHLPTSIDICDGDIVELTAGPDSLLYLWSNGAITPSIHVATAGEYTVLASTNEGCQDNSTTLLNVTFTPELPAPLDSIICPDMPMLLSVADTFPHYLWNTGDTTSSISIQDSGNYYVTAFNACGSDSTTFNIGSWDIETFNIFTPNGDGLNDTFKVRGLRDGTWTLQVYNRWGQLQYKNTDYQNEWDGASISPGNYFYELYEVNTKELCNHKKGWVVIAK